MRADYFRLCFVLRQGGLYVDADDEYQGGDVEPLVGDSRLKLQALCYDAATDSMVDVAQSLEHVAKAERIFYVNNNPLVAAPGHPIVAAALERSTGQLLTADAASRDVQSLTGPGNLTASLVAHAVQLLEDGAAWDFDVVTNWDAVAISKWPLAYRADARNWRNWVRDDD
jgi:mannosyltransferase OCH1-like enzyme